MAGNYQDIHWKNLEEWLSERGYSEKLFPRKSLKLVVTLLKGTLLDKGKMSRNDDSVTFNITYCPLFTNIRSILEELHILLASDE